MASLSITQAWNETAAFMARESRLVLPIGFLLIALPGALFQVLVPTPAPNSLPQPGLWMILIPVALFTTLVGNLAITRLALRTGTSVGEALQHGARRFPIVLAAALLLGLAAAAAAFLLAVIVVAVAGTANPALAALPILLLLPAAIFLWTRLLLMNPVGALESVGPIALIRRSWNLTRGHAVKLLGFLLLLIIVALVVAGAIQAVGGSVIILALGPPAPGSLPFFVLLILSAAVQTVISTLFAVIIARVYAQLAPAAPGDVFA